MNREKKVLLIGSFGAGNLGDELILLTALQDYPEAVVMTAGRRLSERFCERSLETLPPFPTGPRSLLSALVNTLRGGYNEEVYSWQAFEAIYDRLEKVVFVGGGLWAGGLKAVWLWTAYVWWVKKCFPSAKIHLEHQGVDQGFTGLSARLAIWSLRQASVITVRDTASAQAVVSLSGGYVEVVGDRVWEKLSLSKTQTNRPAQPYGLINAVRPIEPEVWNNWQQKFPNTAWRFVAFTPEDRAFVPEGATLEEPASFSATFKLVLEAEVLVGERLHSLIFGARVLGTDKVFLLREPYSQKVTAFVDEVLES